MEENIDQPKGQHTGHLQTLVLNDYDASTPIQLIKPKSWPRIIASMFALMPFNQGKEYLNLKKLKEEQLVLQLNLKV